MSDETNKTGTTETTPQGTEKTFTQTEVDAIVKRRLEKEQAPANDLANAIKAKEQEIKLLTKAYSSGLPPELGKFIKSDEDIEIFKGVIGDGAKSQTAQFSKPKEETPQASFGKFIRGEGDE